MSTLSELIQSGRDLEGEFRRRHKAQTLERYDPKAKRGKQEEFHQSLAFIRILASANGCGKSTALVNEGYANILGYRPWDGTTNGLTRNRPVRVLFCVEDFQHSAEEDLVPMLEAAIIPESIIKIERLATGKPHKWHLKDGSIVKIMSYNQDKLAFEGSVWDYVGFNEPPPRQIFAGLLRGATKIGGRLAFAMTPIGEESAWIHDELYEIGYSSDNPDGDPDIHCITANIWDDGFHRSDEDKRKFVSRLDADEREAREWGRFKFLVGRIYKRFDESVHVLDPDVVLPLLSDPRVPIGIVCDPHDRRPFAIGWFLVTPRNEIIFFDESPSGEYHHTIKSSDKSVSHYAEEMRAFEAAHHSCNWYLMDPNYGKQRRVETLQSIQEAFEDEGFFFDTDIRDSLPEGHLAVKEYLGWDTGQPMSDENRPKIYFTSNCINLIYAVKKYSWKSHRHETASSVTSKPGELGKDFADLIRYTCIYGCHYHDPGNESPSTEAFDAFRSGRRLGHSGYHELLLRRAQRLSNHPGGTTEALGEIPDVVRVALEQHYGDRGGMNGGS